MHFVKTGIQILHTTRRPIYRNSSFGIIRGLAQRFQALTRFAGQLALCIHM